MFLLWCRVALSLAAAPHPAASPTEQVRDTPVIGELAVANPECIDGLEVDRAAGGRDAQERRRGACRSTPCTSSPGRLDRLPADLRPEVGKRLAQRRVQQANALLVWGGPGCGVWSTKSSAKSSSKNSKSSSPWTFSVFRRTTALAASALASLTPAILPEVRAPRRRGLRPSRRGGRGTPGRRRPANTSSTPCARVLGSPTRLARPVRNGIPSRSSGC